MGWDGMEQRAVEEEKIKQSDIKYARVLFP